jgi:catechol 2,3-dioxygenase-like lactoylglutathione lyase family enzyme
MEHQEPAVVSVMLIVSDAATAVGWYSQSMGAELVWDLGGVSALHLQGAPFLVHDVVPGKTKETNPTDAGLTTTRIAARSLNRACDQIPPIVSIGDHRQRESYGFISSALLPCGSDRAVQYLDQRESSQPALPLGSSDLTTR